MAFVSFREHCEYTLYLRREEWQRPVPNTEGRHPLHTRRHRADQRPRAQSTGDPVPNKPPTDRPSLQRDARSRCVTFRLGSIYIKRQQCG